MKRNLIPALLLLTLTALFLLPHKQNMPLLSDAEKQNESLSAGATSDSGDIVDQAEAAFSSGNFQKSIDLYRKALTEEDYVDFKKEIHYNLGQCFYEIDSFTLALNEYRRSIKNSKGQNPLNSQAWNNIGVILSKDQKNEEKQQEALLAFREALKANHTNADARFNYELLKRRMQKEQNQQNQDKNEDKKDENQDKKDQNQDQNKDKQDQKDEQNKKDKGQDEQKKKGTEKQDQQNQKQKQKQPQQGQEGETKQMKMEQARALLDAIDQNEKKFLQQLKKNTKVRQRRKTGPDW